MSYSVVSRGHSCLSAPVSSWQRQASYYLKPHGISCPFLPFPIFPFSFEQSLRASVSAPKASPAHPSSHNTILLLPLHRAHTVTSGHSELPPFSQDKLSSLSDTWNILCAVFSAYSTPHLPLIVTFSLFFRSQLSYDFLQEAFLDPTQESFTSMTINSALQLPISLLAFCGIESSRKTDAIQKRLNI